MTVNRRNFLMAGFAAAVGATTAGAKAIASVIAPKAAANAASVAGAIGAAALSPYGAGVRAQVLEVIVRQGMAGAPWKEICRGPMQVNAITEAEVEKEIKRRQSLYGTHPHHNGNSKDLSIRMSCKECRELLDEDAANEHPNHSPSMTAFCGICKEETIEYRKEWDAAKEEHPSQHADFVTGCSYCWSEYMAGKRPHPKFGLRAVVS